MSTPAPMPTSTPTRQIRKHFTVNFTVPANPDLATLDYWLTEIFALSDQGWCATEPQNPKQHAWLLRGLLICRELMQAGNIPIFESPTIISCAQTNTTPAQWRAVIALAWLDNIPLAAYNLALKSSLNLCAWAEKNPASDASIKHLFNTLNTNVITPLRHMVPTGRSTLPILQAANSKGIPFIHLGSSVYQLGWGCKAQRIDRSTTGADSAMGCKLAQDKAVTARLLSLAGLPAATHEVVTSLDDASKVSRKLGWPVVIKPADCDRGEGVTVGITDATGLKQAFTSARRASKTKKIIVERQVPGCCHRLLIAGGKLLYAIKRLPPSVVGDGHSTIAALIQSAINKQQRTVPWKRYPVNPLNDEVRSIIQQAGYNATSVPTAESRVYLRKIESTQWGGTFDDVTPNVHPENIRIATAAAALFGLQICGIDIITENISQPWHETDAIINEVNYSPLLGGTEVSRKCLPILLDQLLGDDGRIPVDVFVGGNAALFAAQEHCKTLRENGIAACLTNGEHTVDSTGAIWPMPFTSCYQRIRALLLSEKVGAVVIALQSTEFQLLGLPLEQVSSVTWVDNQLQSFQLTAITEDTRITNQQCNALKIQLQEWTAHFREA